MNSGAAIHVEPGRFNSRQGETDGRGRGDFRCDRGGPPRGYGASSSRGGLFDPAKGNTDFGSGRGDFRSFAIPGKTDFDTAIHVEPGRFNSRQAKTGGRGRGGPPRHYGLPRGGHTDLGSSRDNFPGRDLGFSGYGGDRDYRDERRSGSYDEDRGSVGYSQDRRGSGRYGELSEDVVFEVESHFIRLIIGKGREKIKQLGSDSGAKIQILQAETTSNRTRVRLSGSETAKAEAKRLITELLQERRPPIFGASRPNRSNGVSVTSETPHSKRDEASDRKANSKDSPPPVKSPEQQMELKQNGVLIKKNESRQGIYQMPSKETFTDDSGRLRKCDSAHPPSLVQKDPNPLGRGKGEKSRAVKSERMLKAIRHYRRQLIDDISGDINLIVDELIIKDQLSKDQRAKLKLDTITNLDKVRDLLDWMEKGRQSMIEAFLTALQSAGYMDLATELQDYTPSPPIVSPRNSVDGLPEGNLSNNTKLDTIFVYNLPKDITVVQLREHFSEVGTIKIVKKTNEPKIKVYTDEHTGEGTGRAIVTYDDISSANEAIKRFNGQMAFGTDIRVEHSKFKCGCSRGDNRGRGCGHGNIHGGRGGGPPRDHAASRSFGNPLDPAKGNTDFRSDRDDFRGRGRGRGRGAFHGNRGGPPSYNGGSRDRATDNTNFDIGRDNFRR